MLTNPFGHALRNIVYLGTLSILSVALLGANVAFAQAGSKEAQKFQSLGETTRSDIEKSRAQFDQTLTSYNSIVNAEAENPEKAYKTLTKEIDKSAKLWKTAGKSFDKMQDAGAKLFASWQKEIDAFTNEQMKQISVGRFDDMSAKNQQMIDRMTAAQEAYEPFISSLNDQVLFMGRDLSPAAIEALQPLAEELNAAAATLFTNIDALLNQEVEVDDASDPVEADGPATDTSDEPAAVEAS